MGILTVEELKALVPSSLDDEALQGVIDREEAYLAARIGPLVGERTQRVMFYDEDQPIRLQRPASSVVVSSHPDGSDPITGTEVIGGGWRVWRTPLSWPYPTTRASSLYAIYTPSDEDEVRRVLIELCRMTIASSASNTTGLTSETIGSYSYRTDGGSTRQSGKSGPTRGSLWKSLLGPSYPMSVRVRSRATDPWRTFPPAL